MIYLYFNKIEGQYFIINSTNTYDFREPSSNYGLLCKLNLTYNELTLKAGGLYGRIAEQVIDLDTLLTGCRAFKKEEIHLKLNKMLSEYLAGTSPLELATIDIQVKEAENYISSKGGYNSVILKSIADAKSIEQDKLALSVLDRAKEHSHKLIGFKCLKDYIEVKLEAINSLEDFEAFNVEDEITKYQSVVTDKPKAVEADNQHLLSFQSKDNEMTEEIEVLPIKLEKRKDLSGDPKKLICKHTLEKVTSSAKK